jgi:hypothetical protein
VIDHVFHIVGRVVTRLFGGGFQTPSGKFLGIFAGRILSLRTRPVPSRVYSIYVPLLGSTERTTKGPARGRVSLEESA